MIISLFLCISYTIQYLYSWILLGSVTYTLLPISVFNQAQQKIWLVSHICSLAELLHADAMQRLESALLGSPTAKVLDAMGMATQSQKTFTSPSSMFLHLTTTSFALMSTPSVPILEVTEMAEPMEVKASTNKMSPPTTLVSIEIAPSKHCRIIPMPIPATPSTANSSPSRLLLVVVPELAEWINCPGGSQRLQMPVM